MKLWGFAIIAFLSSAGIRAERAGVSLVSFSVQIQTGTAREPLTGLDWMLSVTSTPQNDTPNGELSVADDTVPFSHQGYFILIDPTTTGTTVFPFAMDVPDQGDSNTNGLSDFFDRDLETPGLQTTGRYQVPDGSGRGADLTAKWTRVSGQNTGTVQIALPDFGLTFTHDYTILQYDGVLTYSASNLVRNGSVLLTNVLSPDDVIAGPLSLTVTNNSQLGYDSGAWTNNTGATYTYHSIDSLDQAATNYIALFGIDDGNPATAEPDYQYWFLVIHSSDLNNNGVLDLVENSGVTPQQPRLEIARTAQGFQLTVHGTLGAQYTLEGSNTLSSNSWSTVQLVSLDTETQSLPMVFTDPLKFFRLRQD